MKKLTAFDTIEVLDDSKISHWDPIKQQFDMRDVRANVNAKGNTNYAYIFVQVGSNRRNSIAGISYQKSATDLMTCTHRYGDIMVIPVHIKIAEGIGYVVHGSMASNPKAFDDRVS